MLFLTLQSGNASNIADVLAISRRTVQKHLENVYSKLGVGSRSAARALVSGFAVDRV